MADNEVKIVLLKEELKDFKESMKYQYGEDFMDYPEVIARIEVIENMIKVLSNEN